MYFSTGIAYMLWALGGFGALGFHRFYLRKFPTGLLWMMTGGMGYVGALYDFFTIPRQVAEANMKASFREALGASPRERLVIREHYFDAGSQSAKKESIEKVILRTAKKNNGLVTPGEIAIESDYSPDDARLALEKLASKSFCELRVRPSGVIVYRFPEFVKDDSDFEF